MRTSLPDAGHDDTENAGQWTLLPSHEQGAAPNAPLQVRLEAEAQRKL
jgi:hypothetical protein